MNIYRNLPVRHKNFHEVLPYTYFIQHTVTKVKYYGVRWANKNAPLIDLGITYFSSGVLAEDFKKNPTDYYFRCHYTFDTREDAVEYEMYFVRRIFRKSDWANKNVFPPVYNDIANSLGKRWYNDGIKNYRVGPNDKIPEGLVRGRIMSESHKATIVNNFKKNINPQ